MRNKQNKGVNSPEEVIKNRRRRLRDIAILKSALQKLAVLAVAVVLVFGVIFGLAPMKGNDMEPALASGDLLLYYRLAKTPARNDVVVMDREGLRYVGRLIGMPGDTIVIRNDGTVNIDGNNVHETIIFYDTKPYAELRYPVTLGDDEYFILADKRDTAKDSRYFGPVKSDEIKGKVISSLRRVSM